MIRNRQQLVEEINILSKRIDANPTHKLTPVWVGMYQALMWSTDESEIPPSRIHLEKEIAGA